MISAAWFMKRKLLRKMLLTLFAFFSLVFHLNSVALENSLALDSVERLTQENSKRTEPSLTVTPDSENQECSVPSEDCVVVGEWRFSVGLGFGARTNPVVKKDVVPLMMIPLLTYYGETFYFDNYSLGAYLFENEDHQVSVLVSPIFDGLYFYDQFLGNVLRESSVGSNANNDPIQLHTRHHSAAAGLDWLYNDDHFSYKFSWLTDVSQVHHGQEIRLAMGYEKSALGGSLSTSVGATWKSQKLADYYYGVDIDETSDPQWVYNVEDSLNPFVAIKWVEYINDDDNWQWRINLHYERLSSNIVQSPIIDESSVKTVFIGIFYTF